MVALLFSGACLGAGACGSAEPRTPASTPARESERQGASAGVDASQGAMGGDADGHRFAPPPPREDGWRGPNAERSNRLADRGGELGELAVLEQRLRSLGVALPEETLALGGASATRGAEGDAQQQGLTDDSSPVAKRPSAATGSSSATRKSNESHSAGRPSSPAGAGGGYLDDDRAEKAEKAARAAKDKKKESAPDAGSGRKAAGKGDATDEPKREQPDHDDEREKASPGAGRDGADALVPEEEAVGDRCAAVCEVAEAICALEGRICELAEANPGDDEYAQACARAEADCDAASDACRLCSRE